jgi:hypothetical protein
MYIGMKKYYFLFLSIFALNLLPINSYALSDSEKAVSATDFLFKNLRLESPVQITQEEFVTINDEMEAKRISLHHPQAGLIQLLVQGPKGFASGEKKYPLKFVSAGFMTGEKAALLLPSRTEIIVGFSYPATPEGIQNDPSLFLKTIRIVPGQMALAMTYLSQLSYVDNKKITVIGVSLGGLFLPVSLNLAERLGFHVTRGIVFAYTGADLAKLAGHHLKNKVPDSTLDLVQNLMDSLVTLHRPEMHTQILKGPFLVIEATEDEVFSRASMDALWNSLNGSKLKAKIQGPHINEDRIDMIKQTQGVVESWVRGL